MNPPPGPASPRLTEVAALAGVSTKTVSNVINHFSHVSPQTRLRVEAAIETLGYRPNLSARNLARGRSGLIALVVPQLDLPYFAALAMQTLEAAAAEHWTVAIQQTMGDARVELAAISAPTGLRIDGLILSPTRLEPAELAGRGYRGPLVLLGERYYGGIADQVGIDNVAAARAAVDHLVALGRTRIAMLAPGAQRGNLRVDGYRQALAAHGLAFDDQLVESPVDTRGEAGVQAASRLLHRLGPHPPDAVFCATDWLALGAIRVLRQHGLRVPEDVAVVGFDDIPYGRTATPTLTTISPDRAAIARLAVESLARQGRADRDPGEVAVVQQAPFELIVRESTAGAR